MNRSEEIKIRVTPLEKSAWQEAAEHEQTSLSNLIRRAMQDVVYPRVPHPTAIGGTLTGIDEDDLWRQTPVTTLRDWSGFTPQTDVPTSGEVESKEERRSEPCSCGKPPWLFCSACDA